jgi:cell cycle serine/threonine-protein kinase CDC5/MSD2
MRETSISSSTNASATRKSHTSAACSLSSPPLLPELAGQFKCLRRIGAGQYGSVFLALHPATQEAVAIKSLPLVVNFVPGSKTSDALDDAGAAPETASAAQTPSAAELRLLNEIAALRAITAAGVVGAVSLLDVVECAGKTFLITSFSSAITLEAHLLAHGAMAECFARRTFRQLSKTVRSIHSAGWVHHDLSLQNILIAPDGITTIVDFGLSQPLSDNITSFGATPYFAAPELLLRLSHDSQVDVWALGVILFALLQARLPFPAATLRELKQKVERVDTDPLPFSASTPPCADARALIKALLKLEPSQRITIEQVMLHDWMCAPESPSELII